VVVSTATLALQSQLLRDDLPLAAAARGKPIRAELLKGRSNYACRRMVVQLGMRLFDRCTAMPSNACVHGSTPR